MRHERFGGPTDNGDDAGWNAYWPLPGSAG
jgi:hypothetical protein